MKFLAVLTYVCILLMNIFGVTGQNFVGNTASNPRVAFVNSTWVYN
uniref:Uncharacterized protein n=1 Tax=Ciona savignyi TaxID=51511 RepID=H2ZGQ9_CIOSA